MLWPGVPLAEMRMSMQFAERAVLIGCVGPRMASDWGPFCIVAAAAVARGDDNEERKAGAGGGAASVVRKRHHNLATTASDRAAIG